MDSKEKAEEAVKKLEGAVENDDTRYRLDEVTEWGK
jgi:hypothetical protein